MSNYWHDAACEFLASEHPAARNLWSDDDEINEQRAQALAHDLRRRAERWAYNRGPAGDEVLTIRLTPAQTYNLWQAADAAHIDHWRDEALQEVEDAKAELKAVIGAQP